MPSRLKFLLFFISFTLLNFLLHFFLMASTPEWSVSVRPFDSTRSDILLYTLKFGKFEVCVTNLGSTITNILVPDRLGNLDDVVLGFDTLTPYLDGTSPYFGCVVGRVANRIANATFQLDGKTFHLPKNDRQNTLHGGIIGFDKKVWSSAEVADKRGPSVAFSLFSEDGDQGFPGDLQVKVVYTLTKNFELITEMNALTSNKSTPVNLAHHTYWNLRGHHNENVLNHEIKILSNFYTPVNEHLIPTGEILPVKDSPFDYTEFKLISKNIHGVSGGYDHNFVLKEEKEIETNFEKEDKNVIWSPNCPDLKLSVVVKENKSGRKMEIFTNADAVQFYTGNFLDGSIHGKYGMKYGKHFGFCFETQGFPNAINEPKFPSIILRPGQTYKHNMVHRFSTV